MKAQRRVSRPRAKRSGYPVRTLNTVQEALRALHGGNRSWRQVQAEFYPSVPWSTLANVAAGRDPRKASIRLALGLSPLAPSDAQVNGAAAVCPNCECHFIRNHPRRLYCYACSPPRARRS